MKPVKKKPNLFGDGGFYSLDRPPLMDAWYIEFQLFPSHRLEEAIPDVDTACPSRKIIFRDIFIHHAAIRS